MAVTPTALIQPRFAQATQTNEYAATGTVIIDKATFTNVGAGAVLLSVWVVPPAGAPANSNQVIAGRAIAPNEAYVAVELSSHVLGTGAQIWVNVSAANSVVMYASGRAIS